MRRRRRRCIGDALAMRRHPPTPPARTSRGPACPRRGSTHGHRLWGRASGAPAGGEYAHVLALGGGGAHMSIV
eukprot:7408385-Pyramimonas_sp.AAC.1